MDNKNRACMVESDEEDVDGDLLENNADHSSAESEASKGESDEEYVNENLSDKSSSARSESSMVESDEDDNLSKKNSKSRPTRSKIAVKKEVVYLPDDSLSFQTGDLDDETEILTTDDKSTDPKIQNQMKKAKQTRNQKFQSKKSQIQTKKRENSMSSDESVDSISSKKFVSQPTPLCDAIMKDVTSSIDDSHDNNEQTNKKRTLRGSKTNNQSKNTRSSDQNQMGQDLINVDKIDPEQCETDLVKVINPLLVKEEDDFIKLEVADVIKEDIEINDEIKEDIKLLPGEDKLTDSVNVDECVEALRGEKNVVENNELKPCNKQNTRKRTKRKNEEDEDPSYASKTKKLSTRPTKNTNGQLENTCHPTTDLSKIDDTQSAVIPKRKRGRPPKRPYPLAERNKESENSLLSDAQVANKMNKNIISTQNKKVNETSSDLQPTTSAVSCVTNNAQSYLHSLNLPVLTVCLTKLPDDHDSIVRFKNYSSGLNSLKTKLEPIDKIDLELIKSEECINPTIDQENVFGNTDLSCLQDNSEITSNTDQTSAGMTTKEINLFIADYLTSHQIVFDNAFFENILPVLAEILMLCMDEFTELLVRSKKAENITSEELRQQEVTLAMQSFCSIVSSFSERFFPNFNSVMYKINQNKAKKGLLIALVFFVANSVWAKAPKFKGQIHTMRKILMCMCQIRKINSPLFFTVLTTSEQVFNEELRLLVKILLVLQKNNVLELPTTALPETSNSETIEETCNLIVSSSISCSNDSESTSKHPEIAALFKDKTQPDFQGMEEGLGYVLSKLKQNSLETHTETLEEGSFETDFCHSLTQQNVGRVFAEILGQDQGVGLDSLFGSYLKSTFTSNTKDHVKAELGVDNEDAVLPHNPNLRFSMPSDNIEKVMLVDEVDCGSLLEVPENTRKTNKFTISKNVNILESDE